MKELKELKELYNEICNKEHDCRIEIEKLKEDAGFTNKHRKK